MALLTSYIISYIHLIRLQNWARNKALERIENRDRFEKNNQGLGWNHV